MKVRCRSLRFLGFPCYKVGENGSVWSKWSKCGTVGGWKKLKNNLSTHDRLYVDLHDGTGRRKRFEVHRLVLLAFVGPPPSTKSQCCHFPDRSPTNNWVHNLRWGTQSENEKDKVFHRTSNDGIRNGNGRLSAAEVRQIRRLYATGRMRQRDIGRMFGIKQPHVSEIVNNKKRQVA